MKPDNKFTFKQMIEKEKIGNMISFVIETCILISSMLIVIYLKLIYTFTLISIPIILLWCTTNYIDEKKKFSVDIYDFDKEYKYIMKALKTFNKILDENKDVSTLNRNNLKTIFIYFRGLILILEKSLDNDNETLLQLKHKLIDLCNFFLD